MPTTGPYEFKKGDTFKPIQATLSDADGPAPLSGATVLFVMKQEGGAKLVEGLAEIVDANAGTVRYRWQAGDTDTAGVFFAEWQVTFPGGGQETFPSKGWERVIVYDLLND